MDDYDIAQEFRARMDHLDKTIGEATGAAAFFFVRLHEEGEDYVAGKMAEINNALGEILGELPNLAAHLY